MFLNVGAQHGAAARAEPAAHRAKPAAAACVGQPFDAAHFATQLAARGAHRAWAALWSGSAMRSPHIALVSIKYRCMRQKAGKVLSRTHDLVARFSVV